MRSDLLSIFSFLKFECCWTLLVGQQDTPLRVYWRVIARHALFLTSIIHLRAFAGIARESSAM